MRKCKHPHRLDRGFTVMCLDCERNGIESLGPSNDELLDAIRETDAARIIAKAHEVFGGQPSGPSGIRSSLTNAQEDGYLCDEASPFADLAAWHIGYLVRAAVDDDGEGWPWNVSLPIAGQYEEWIKAKQHTDDKALRREAYDLNAPVREFAEELAAALQSSPPDAMDDEHYDILPDAEQR